MFQAIIIDDEPKICNLIQMLGDWNTLSVEIIATFCDSEDALQFILTHKPDIVITDIKMPVYDGLELIEHTRSAGIHCAFIIISGYRHFEYAHKAMQFGIVDYLLKPLNEEELNKTLAKICQNLISKKMENDKETTYHNLLAEKHHNQRSTLLKDLDKNNLKAEELSAFNTAYSTDCIYENFRVLLLNTSLPQLHISNSSFQSKIEDIAQLVFAERTFAFTISDSRGIFCFINYSSLKSNTISNDISRFFNHIGALSDIYGSFALSLGVGNEVPSLLFLRESYLNAIVYEKTKLVLGWNRILSYLPDCLNTCGESSSAVSGKELKNLQIYLEALNTDNIKLWFDTWRTALAKYEFPDIPALYQTREKILAVVAQLFPELSDNNEIKIQTNCARNVPDFIGKLQKYILSAVESRIIENTQLELLPIRQAKEYIKSCYYMPITLEEVAAVIKYNPSYFSTVFKKHTGQNFSEYLIEVRIEEAKHLLRTSQLNIIEISEKIGYSDSKYFRKLFKKLTGIKPSDYRKLYQ